MDTEGLLNRFPVKVELHVHICGAIRHQTLLDIAQKRGIKIPSNTIEGLRNEVVLEEGSTLNALIHSFGVFMPVIAGDRDAVYRMAYEFCEDCAKQGTRYVEARYIPHIMANTFEKPPHAAESGSFSPRDVVTTITEALKKGSEDFNIIAKSILSCARHKPDWSLEVASLCKEFRDSDVVAIDIAAAEELSRGDPKRRFHLEAFLDAKKHGIHRTAHAGEVGPPIMIYEALDDFCAERIGHGYRTLEDPVLYKRLKAEAIHLETCPISSLKTSGAPNGRKDHPIVTFANDGANFSISSDDPTVFDNTLTDDYVMASKLGLSEDQIIESIFNAARSCFASENEKKQLMADLVKVYGEQRSSPV